MLIIFGQEQDPHVLEIANSAHKICDTTVLNHYDFFEHTLDVRKGVINDYANDAIYYFRIKPNFFKKLEFADRYQEGFWYAEWANFIQGLSHTVNISNQIDPLTNAFKASNKIYQLKTALSCGLSVPATIVTNKYNCIIEFLSVHKRIIYKALSSILPANNKTLYTHLIDHSNIGMLESLIQSTPGIFQNFVEKEYELRIFANKSTSCAAKVAPKSGLGQIDWRIEQRNPIYYNYSVNKSLQQKMAEYLSKVGLDTGVFDFIKSSSGEYIFLECNPHGQWLPIGAAEDGERPSRIFAEVLISKLESLQ